MRAAVLQGFDIVIADVPEPRPAAGQILVAPKFNGICGSDLHARAARREAAAHGTPPRPSLVPGHEFSAEVIEVARGTDTPFRPGDRVVPIPFAKSAHGLEIVGLSPNFSGGLAPLSVVIADRCFRVPDGLAYDLAALTEPLAVGLHAANLANRNAGPNMVIGCGPVGLAVILSLKLQGRGPIIAADFSAERRALAEAFGADIVVDPAKSSPYAHWDQIGFSPAPTSPLLEREFSGRPTGVNIFECVGASGLIDQVIKAAPIHSHIVVVGVCAHVDHHTPIEANMRELTLEYSFAYRPGEFAAALRMIDANPDMCAKMITDRLPLARTAEAFETLANMPTQVKVLIDPNA